MPDTPDAVSGDSRPKTLLAFDVGGRRIGVATGQTLTRDANALTTIVCSAHSPDWTAIGKLVEEWRPDLVIVGLPIRADGSDSDSTRMARDFAKVFQDRFAIPVTLHDERLSSAEARDRLRTQRREGQLTRKTRKGDIDRLAAAIILQSWLNEYFNHGD
jgi:putative Holliday junction resolvase